MISARTPKNGSRPFSVLAIVVRPPGAVVTSWCRPIRWRIKSDSCAGQRTVIRVSHVGIALRQYPPHRSYAMNPQILWCARCHTVFTFTGARVERTAGGKLARRHEDCGALNELPPNGESEDGSELWKVVGEVRHVH
jgi:hypothetical protein